MQNLQSENRDAGAMIFALTVFKQAVNLRLESMITSRFLIFFLMLSSTDAPVVGW